MSLEAEQQPGGVTTGDLTADVATAQLNLLEWAGWQDRRARLGTCARVSKGHLVLSTRQASGERICSQGCYKE